MKMMADDQTPLDFVQTVLADDQWGEIAVLENRRTLRAVFEGTHGKFWVFVKVPEEMDVLLCYCRCPFDAPPDARVRAVELIARINYGLRVGNFELDLDGGEIRFKSSLDFRDIQLSDRLLLNVLLPCPYAMDRFLPALEALLQQGESVVSSLARAGLTL